ncbi:MAG: acyltransferase family protein [Prevotella sp.]|nr:acyltransferase family protein [Prevotella sp.]
MAIQERDNSVTIAKALAIMLMVLQHSGCPVWLNHFVRIFIMPLFFFMSGYCFKIKYLNDSLTFLKRRIDGVYRPIVKWSVVFVLLHNLFFSLNIYNEQYGAITRNYSLSDSFYKLIHNVVMMKDFEPLLGGYWFMNSLLWGSLFFFIVLKVIKNSFVGAMFLLVITFAFSFFQWRAPFFDISAREFLASFFLMAGHCFAVHQIKSVFSWSICGLSFIVVALGSVLMAASMLHFNHLTLIPYVICALSGIIVTFSISDHIQKHDGCPIRILIYCGNHTLDILTWHFLAFKLVSLLIVMVFGLQFARLAELPVIHGFSIIGWWILYTIVGISIPLLVRYLYERF